LKEETEMGSSGKTAGKLELTPVSRSAGFTVYLVKENGVVLGFLRKGRDTATDELPWQAFGASFRPGGPVVGRLLGSFFDEEGGQKAAVARLRRGSVTASKASPHFMFRKDELMRLAAGIGDGPRGAAQKAVFDKLVERTNAFGPKWYPLTDLARGIIVPFEALMRASDGLYARGLVQRRGGTVGSGLELRLPLDVHERLYGGSVRLAAPKLDGLVREFEVLQAKNREFGATDTEPDGLFSQLMALAIEGKPFPSVRPESWQLFDDVEGWKAAANAMTKKAKDIYDRLRRAPYVDALELAKYHGWA
jgi:hypothetical protein